MQIKSSEKMPLLELLGILSPDSSKNTLRSWIEKGRVTVDNKLAQHPNQTIESGQEIVVGTKPKFLKNGLKIVYEDDHLVVVDKPRGLLSVATDMETEFTVHAFLKHRFHSRKVHPIHRLDKETSGLLVFAYTEQARDHLKKQLEMRTMHREYRAVVHGHPGKGTWRCFLYEDKRMKMHVCSRSEGKEAITHFETIKKQKKTSILKVKLESGRKHQIRVQAAHFGHPVVGDSKYGPTEDTGHKLQLRAVKLEFEHPMLKERLLLSENGR
ncbi:MAG: Ribosomal large subunit pseudouridine synthase D [Chlamydiae bacterium]|nr:Ribosomal large subunit pseudouridine synthase D [Chlamydiota bacterium]